MKRLRSSSDDIEESNSNSNLNRSSSHRSFYYNKPENGSKKGLSVSSTSRFARTSADEDRESSRVLRKRPEHDFEEFDRRKGFDRSKDGGGGDRGGFYGSDRIQRSESFCGPRREFPKGIRSERDRPRREGSVSSLPRFGGIKDFNEGGNSRSGSGSDLARGVTSRVRSPRELRDVDLRSPTFPKESGSEVSKMRTPREFRDGKLKSPTWSSKESGSEQSKIRSGKGLRDGMSKSPTRSKESGSEQSRMRSPRILRDEKSPPMSKDSESEQSMMRSPVILRDEKSPPIMSKDSESEQSKSSMEVRKNDESRVETDSSSEMEEGELEPEPEPEPEPIELAHEAEIQGHVELNSQHKEEVGYHREEAETTHTENPSPQEGLDPYKEGNFEHNNVENAVNELPDNTKDLNCLTSEANGGKEEIRTTDNNDGGSNEQYCRENSDCNNYNEYLCEQTLVEKASLQRDKHMGINLEVKREVVDLIEPNKEVTEENKAPEINFQFTLEGQNQDYKDKGKSVAVSSSHDSAQNNVWIERGSRDLLSCRNNSMEGSSIRGFELFSNSPVKRSTDPKNINKHKDEKMELESLDLSLSLPNVLLPIGSRDAIQAPGSPTQTRSFQSMTNTFLTNSDGFTASMSFSGSQTFMHNPSCSMTQNSFDHNNFEQSVGSHPIFLGIDLISNDPKHKEVPIYQRASMNGNSSRHKSQTLLGMSNGQEIQVNQERVIEGSTKLPIGLDRQLSFHNQLSSRVHPNHDNDVQAASQSAGSHRTASEYNKDKRRVMKEKSSSSLNRSISLKEGLLAGGADFTEAIISRIVSEPIHIMARRFHEIPEQTIACLKETVCEIMLKADKHVQLCTFQKILQNRTDTTMEVLIKSHRAQLEILVALKTGVKEFLQGNNSISSSDLAEIFLNLKCRNISCRSPLPVDECDCKFCVQKKGFCSACMCLICSKFDMASNSCSWVGCDVCQHWCHTDCALRESYIKSGSSTIGTEGTSEMQFRCVACNHPSEMFGFVKEVFQNFAKDWSAESLSRELEYVKRIFYASKDLRGKQLHDITDKLQARLVNKANLPEVYTHIMGILSGRADNNPTFLNQEIPNKNKAEGRKVIGEPSQEDSWRNSVYQERAPQLENRATFLPYLDKNENDKYTVDVELQRNGALKEPVFDELESIVRMKHAEAKMFQTRADDARREAEGLKRIAIAKNEKAEEEYASRVTKLCLAEAEELRRQKLEELQVLERAHGEYFNMKMRMEADIKDLLLKMETTRRNLAM